MCNQETDAGSPGTAGEEADETGALSRHMAGVCDALHCGVLIVDGRGAIRAVNDHLTAILGYDRAELEGRSVGELVPERFRDRHGAQVARYFERPYMRRMGSGVEIVGRHKSGEEVPLEIGLAPFRFGGREYIVATVINIAEHKEVERKLLRAQQDVRTILDNLPAMIGYWDKDLRNRFGNHAYLDWFGVEPERMFGRHIREVIGEKLFALNYPYMEAALAGKPQFFERAIPTPDGAVRHSQAAYIPDTQAGHVEGFFVLVTDITPLKRAEQALFAEKERMRVTLSSIGDAVITTDREGNVSYLNPIAEEMTGWTAEAASGLAIEDVMVIRDAATGATMTNPVRLAIEENRIVAVDSSTVLARRDGSEYNIEDSAAPIRNGAEGTIGAVIVFHDVSEVRALALKMSHMAQHDALTDLPNRLLLHDRISQVIQFAKRTGIRFAVLFLDLDNFKKINDSLGHEAGDELLRKVAKRLTNRVEATDTVSRLGGDEFILLLSQVESGEQAGQIAQRLLDSIAAPFSLRGEKLTVTFSIGISLYPDDGEDSDTLIRHADAAMYSAKYSGRNRYQFFSPSIEAAVQARHVLEQELREALEGERFALHYQLIVDTATGRRRNGSAATLAAARRQDV